ncbi:MAG: RNA-binding S4 domain-containing protein [Muribaculaceae bacterium]|nr:RNA-binding S4 domain-containing protein [Muribaculaceae bacterium]
MENSNEKKPKRPRIGQGFLPENNDRPRYDRPYESRPRPEGAGESQASFGGDGENAQFGAPRQYQRPYQPRPQGGYQRNNSYNRPQNNGGGYQRPYNPNYQRPQSSDEGMNAEGQQSGGYQRQSYNPNYQRPQRQGGYNQGPRQQGGYNSGPRQGGYNQGPRQQGGYNNGPRQGGYNQGPRQQGGYNNGPRQGGYNHGPRQQGGYNQNRRPQQGGYNQGPRQQGGAFPARGKSFTPRPKRIEYEMPIPDPNEQMRLNKFMSNSGICSRREADEFIQQGLVKVNGQVVTELGTKISHTDVVEYDDKVVTMQSKCYILLNKPKDCVTTSDDPNGRTTVLDLVKGACPERIYPVGRLDRNTTGVLLLTNDGDLASKLTHPKFVKKKIYHVWCDRDIAEEDMQRIADGIELEDGPIHADAISYATETDRNQAGIEIHSGRNRIVRRIFESLGYHVTKLDRVYFAGLTKKNLPRGRWRYLTQEEVNYLKMGSFE